MSEETSKPVEQSPQNVRRPIWLRLTFLIVLALMFVFVLFPNRVITWLEADLGLGFAGAVLTVLLLTVSLLLVLLIVGLTYAQRRKRE